MKDLPDELTKVRSKLQEVQRVTSNLKEVGLRNLATTNSNPKWCKEQTGLWVPKL